MAENWTDIDRATRRRVRRLVRIGRLPEDEGERALARELVASIRAAVWWRFFWVWFVPATLLSLAAAARVHPVLVGVTMALAGQSLFTRRNVNRAAG